MLCIDRSPLGCDVNHDGHLDVRDLVRMARCLRLVPGDSTGDTPCFDCDGDGLFGIPDLFCCAREILRGPGTPPDSAHVESALRVALDTPERDGNGVRVRLRLSGARMLGAALLRLSYPADRWQLLVASNPGAADPEGWLPLADAGEAGLLRVGALRLSDVAADELVVELHAVPIAGAAQSGNLSVEGADLSAPDGAMLSPASALPSMPLALAAPATTVELSAARPNPFTQRAAFTVSLPRDAEVDLAVHDLAGRRVATLAHGRLGAGRRDFTWDGAGVRDGVYFVRLTVDGRVLSTRAALLRDSR